MRLVRAAKTGYIAASILNILIGLVLIVWPAFSAEAICAAAGVIVALTGAAKLFGYFTNDLYRLAFQYDLALGSLTILLGILMLLMPDVFSKILVFAAAVYVIVNAIFTLQTAVEANRFGLERWWLLLVGAALSALVGVLLLLRPFESALAITRLIGIAFAADGVQNLLVAVFTIRIQERGEFD